MKKLMIAVSTAQNTTNIIPAVQLNVDYFVFVETTGAAQKKWSVGAEQVLKNRGIEVLERIKLTKEENSRIDLIINKVQKFLERYNDFLIYWNAGGGQKPQQFALFKLYLDRTKVGNKDILCYANAENHKLEFWYVENDFLKYKADNINVNLNAKEIFTIFGKQANYNLDNIFFSDQKKIKYKNHNSFKLLENSLFISYLKKWENNQHEVIEVKDKNLKRLLNQILEKNIEKISFRDFYNIILSDQKKIEFLYEKFLVDRIYNFLTTTQNHACFEAYYNVTIDDEKNRVAEYDVLIITKWGTVLALDAKTGKVKKKDIDARIKNLREGAGRYIDFVVVVDEKDEERLKKLDENKIKYITFYKFDDKIKDIENYLREKLI